MHHKMGWECRGWMLSVLLLAAQTAQAASEPLNGRQQRAREIYRELIEIDTSATSGDTLAAARAMAARLLAAGFAADDVRVIETAPRRGNLVARLRGRGNARPMLLLAHLDVVDARREDWSTDPFKLVEKDGYFYARGSEDDKYMAAAFISNLIRYREDRFRPERDIIVALTTDEEITDREGLGLKGLLKNHRALIEAEFALNEGGALATRDGKPLWNSVQTSEKLYQDYWLEVTNDGGHSAQPRADNAITELSVALTRLAAFQFPLALNDTTRLYFERMSALENGQLAMDFKSIASPAPDPAAVARVSALPQYNNQLRTTCVATRLQGGHANNALPQSARALLNCRIMPGGSAAATAELLRQAIGSDAIKLSLEAMDTPSEASPIDARIFGVIEELSRSRWPGVPVLPTMSAGATDSRLLRNAGIPTYGHSGLAIDMADRRAHGKDERVLVSAFYQGQEYLYQLVRRLANLRE